MKLKAIAQELVNRAREGDQNAMALIRRTSDSAGRGSRKAKNAYTMIMSYIREHPIVSIPEHALPKHDKVSGEVADAIGCLCDHMSADWIDNPQNLGYVFALPSGGNAGLMAGAVILADGPDLTDERIYNLGAHILNDNERNTFYEGVSVGSKENGSQRGFTLSPEDKRVFNVGRAVGTARSIQIVRKGGDLAHHNECMAWELG